MRVISHRGNLGGPGKDSAPGDVRAALDAGFDVEVDVRMDRQGGLRLGHDAFGEIVPEWMLADSRVWFHAKNYAAAACLGGLDVKVFCHDNDPFVIIGGRLWVHPNTDVDPSQVKNAILLDIAGFNRLNRWLGDAAFAVCSDWPEEWK